MAASGQDQPNIVLILGSGPDAPDAAAWPRQSFSNIVAINNAWQVRPDWDFLIHPEDFAPDRLPADIKGDAQVTITANEYVPIQNHFGGFVYAGGTMAYTAGYWALGALKPDVLAFFGCDMNYGQGQTHFYGKGTADPLRDDITLQSLEAKSARLMFIAAARGCLTVNLSEQAESRLVFPNHTISHIAHWTKATVASRLAHIGQFSNQTKANEALSREEDLGYMAVSGRYWEEPDRFDPEELRKLDSLWLGSARR